MTSHHCDKEIQLAEMQKDIRSILELLKGNGKPGLLQQTEANTKARLVFYGFLLAISSGISLYIIKLIIES